MSVALSTSLIFIWMPTSASWACITSASCTLIGRLFVVSVKEKPPALPPSASLAFALTGSRLIGAIDLSYAQLVGGIGPLAGTPTLSHTPLTIWSRSSAQATAWRSGLLLNGGLVGLSVEGEVGR